MRLRRQVAELVADNLRLRSRLRTLEGDLTDFKTELRCGPAPVVEGRKVRPGDALYVRSPGQANWKLLQYSRTEHGAFWAHPRRVVVGEFGTSTDWRLPCVPVSPELEVSWTPENEGND